MQFTVGDKVIHPRLGAGRITSVENREIVEGFRHYYVIEIPSKESIIYIPIDKVDDLGLRPATPRAKLSLIIETLRGTPVQLSEDPKERQEQVREKLDSGFPVPIAEVIRDLSWLQHTAHLTKREQDLLDWGQDFLAGEIALVRERGVADARKEILDVLEGSLETALALDKAL